MSGSSTPPMIIYANLMEEVKLRFAALDRGLKGELALPDMLVEELAYFQLRLLCEDIALGCLVAHGDITQLNINQLSDEYDADKIIKALGYLHPDFYPQAVELTIGVGVHIEPKTEGFLTKQELLELYGGTGNFAHRGKLKRLEKRPPYTDVNFAEIARWTNKIIALLNTHQIVSSDNQKRWMCTLKNRDDSDRVQVVFAETRGVV
jgi:hypothetical protein